MYASVAKSPKYAHNRAALKSRPIECNFYSYVANRPTRWFDLDGKRISVTGSIDSNGIVEAVISFSANIEMLGQTKIPLEQLKSFRQQMIVNYKNTFSQSGKGFNLSAGTISITINPSATSDQHIIGITEEPGFIAEAIVGGRRMLMAYDICLGDATPNRRISDVFSHEVGHLAGLTHSWPSDRNNPIFGLMPFNNLMKVTTKASPFRLGNKLTEAQIRWLLDNPMERNHGIR